MNAKVKKGLKIASDILFWIFFVLAILFTVIAFSSKSSSKGYPKFGNTALFTIESDSMNVEGGFKKNDLIITHVLSDDEKDQLKVGDVITFVLPGTSGESSDQGIFNTHRIVEEPVKDASGHLVYVQTKGDANTTKDGYKVLVDNIEARWDGGKIGALGGVISFLRQPYGFWPCIIVPLCGFLGYEIFVLVTTIQKTKNKDKRLISKADEELIKQQAVEEFLKKQQEEAKNKDENK